MNRVGDKGSNLGGKGGIVFLVITATSRSDERRAVKEGVMMIMMQVTERAGMVGVGCLPHLHIRHVTADFLLFSLSVKAPPLLRSWPPLPLPLLATRHTFLLPPTEQDGADKDEDEDEGDGMPKRMGRPPKFKLSELQGVEDQALLAYHRRLIELGVSDAQVIRRLEDLPELTSYDQKVEAGRTFMNLINVSANVAFRILAACPALLKESHPDIILRMDFLKSLVPGKNSVPIMVSINPQLLLHPIENMRAVHSYLISVHIPAEELPGVYQKRPQVLTLDLDLVSYTIGNLLADTQILPKDMIRILKKVPELFSPLTTKNLKPRIEFFHKIGLVGGPLGKGLARRPNLLNTPLDSATRSYDYLLTYVRREDLAKLIKRFPEVLVLDPIRKMEPIVVQLMRLGVQEKNIGKVLLRRPQLLGYTSAGFEPTIQYLLDLGVRESMLGRIITLSPQVLTMNCEEKLKPIIDHLKSLGLERSEDIERLLVRNAQLLCCSIEKNINPKLNFFLKMGLSEKDVIRIMVLFPSMFGQSIEGSLAPKYDYLVNVMGRSPSDIVDFPQYFGYSLEKRIKPRHKLVQEKGIHLSLASMLACVEKDFVSRYISGPPRTRPRAAG